MYILVLTSRLIPEQRLTAVLRWQARNEMFYNGFREHHMLGMFINLFCALSYFAKMIESMTEQGAGFPVFTTIKYLDYLFTCPLTVLDLLWHMDAPFRVTMTGLTFICLGIVSRYTHVSTSAAENGAESIHTFSGTHTLWHTHTLAHTLTHSLTLTHSNTHTHTKQAVASANAEGPARYCWCVVSFADMYASIRDACMHAQT